jgi:hypothetical protein
VSCSTSGQRLQPSQPSLDILAHVYAQRPPATFRQDVKVSTRLHCLYHTKGIFLSGHRQVHHVVTRDLQKDPRTRSTLVRWPGCMQEARAVAEARRDLLGIADRLSHRLQ